ncbi:hypothetical protein [Aneurinibacillus aneurinilyticus]|jgi:DNA segregation ATPase FtsK/SpoIIIE-like protein|uniref:hypothetical protein n=1 Tax=Aneurinibacillus aneurinilyticus TaxID=1391 RepID=UPI0023F70C8B|nr:hypothetical protein [Aneurinibacillus aneurinilyticus]MCI1696483.1 hypothetical protein [Aneurinibacillus aneurinilyticus]
MSKNWEEWFELSPEEREERAYQKAKQLVIASAETDSCYTDKKGVAFSISHSLISRRLRLGHEFSKRIISRLVADGIIKSKGENCGYYVVQSAVRAEER